MNYTKDAIERMKARPAPPAEEIERQKHADTCILGNCMHCPFKRGPQKLDTGLEYAIGCELMK